MGQLRAHRWIPWWWILTIMTLLECSTFSSASMYHLAGDVLPVGTNPTATRLIRQTCFQGFKLTRCQDRNVTAKVPTSRTYFLPENAGQPWCLQCCNPARASPVIDETWNLACPLVQSKRGLIYNGEWAFYFPRRANTLEMVQNGEEDPKVVMCLLERLEPDAYLIGYDLEIEVVEYSLSWGRGYWNGVTRCVARALESTTESELFIENIHLVNLHPEIPSPSPDWILPLVFLIVLGLLLAIPLVQYRVYHITCVNCGSWFVFCHEFCLWCMILGCRCYPVPAKVHSGGDDSNNSSSDPLDTKLTS